MELNATNPAAYCVSPFARSFQTITMAIQRARPIRIIPYMYGRLALFSPGKSLKNRMAKANMRIGPITQFWTRESPKIFTFLNTSPSSSYFTFARGGYIMMINPMAIGILVVPDDMLFQKFATDGFSQPESTPINMARKIHSVRFRSRKFNRFCEDIVLMC